MFHRRHHPVLRRLVRAAACRQLLAAGRSPADIDRAFAHLGTDGVDEAFALADVTPPATLALPDAKADGLTAAGDHPVIEAVLAWIASPVGQAVVGALVKLLLAALL